LRSEWSTLTNSLDLESGRPRKHPHAAPWLRRIVVAAAALAIVLGATLALLLRGRHVQSSSTGDAAEEATQLSEWTDDRRCSLYPYLKFLGMLHNNLGGRGPDPGPEGIVYLVQYLGAAAGPHFGEEQELVLNAESEYYPFAPKLNGFSGQYGSINIARGTTVDVSFSLRNHVTKKPLTMPEVAFTFFDLDEGHNHSCIESITVGGFKDVALSRNTEVRQIPQADGRTKFTGSQYGVGEDNPSDPQFLTELQQNRAVSLIFHNFQQKTVTFGATWSEHKSPRSFTMIGRPSLLCARTVPQGYTATTQAPMPTSAPAPVLLPLHMQPGETPVEVDSGMTFEGWKAKVGHMVTKGDPIASLSPGMHIVTAPHSGIVSAMQDLQPGDSIDARVPDKRIAVLENVFEPLQMDNRYEAAVSVPQRGAEFVEWEVVENYTVKKDEVIAIVKFGKARNVIRSPGHGKVVRRQPLIRGDIIARKMVGTTIALVDLRYPALEVDPSFQTPLSADAGATLKTWLVPERHVVAAGDPIAVATLRNGSEVIVRAPNAGIVEVEENLRPGDVIGDTIMGSVVATVGGKWPPLELRSHSEEQGVSCDPRFFFVEWHQEKGDKVHQGDDLATVSAAPPGPHATGHRYKIKVPMDGYIKDLQPLKRGQQVGQSIMGVPPNIASIGVLEEDVPLPWWLWPLLGFLGLVGMCLILLLCCKRRTREVTVSSKYKFLPPVKEPAPPASPPRKVPPAPAPPQPKSPNRAGASSTAPGLRLGFLDLAGNLRTVTAEYRPLGVIVDEHAALKVTQWTFNSYARHLGVQKGWTIAKVGSVSVDSSTDMVEVKRLLNEGLRPLRLWPLRMDFQVSGETKTYRFEKRPIGLEFVEQAPIRVKVVYPNSHARELCIRDHDHDGETWIISRIGSEDLPVNDHDFHKIYDMLREGTAALDPYDGSEGSQDQLKGYD